MHGVPGSASLAELRAAAENSRRDCEVIGRAHYMCSDSLSRRNQILGIPATVAATIVGTTIFGTLEDSSNIYIKIAAGLVSILAAVLAALQTFLNPLKESERHRTAGGKFLALKREFELYELQFRENGEADTKNAFPTLEKLFRDRSKLSEESPNIPDKFWTAACKQYNWPPKHSEKSARLAGASPGTAPTVQVEKS